jgi:hypothetical protein
LIHIICVAGLAIFAGNAANLVRLIRMGRRLYKREDAP